VTQQRLDYAPSRLLPVDEARALPQSRRSRYAALRGYLRAHRRAWTALRGVREIVLVLAVYTLYDFTRFLVAGDGDGAIAHGRSILSLETRLNLAPERWLNHVVSPHALLAVPADYIYATLHYIVTPVVLIWLWRRHADAYGNARTTLMIATIIGLVGFSLLPVAPPRMLPGFVDTMAQYSHWGWWGGAASAPRGLAADTNQYAAMPSLHVGWAIWCGWQLVRLGKHRVTKVLGVLYPLLIASVVMATANHYFADVVAGCVVVLIGAGLAKLFSMVDWRVRRKLGRPPMPVLSPVPPEAAMPPAPRMPA
jgi:hypothetical protein